jgi:hypothetical protein
MSILDGAKGLLYIGEALLGIGVQLKRIADIAEMTHARDSFASYQEPQTEDGSYVTYYDHEAALETERLQEELKNRGGKKLGMGERPPRPVEEEEE